MTENPLIPSVGEIISLNDETPDTRTFHIRCDLEDYKPGQFVELSVFGYGEAPISISSIPNEGLRLTARKVGQVTSALFRLKEGSKIGLRGPFGRPFPMDEMRGHDLVIVGGGIGLAPLRPVIVHAIKNRNDFGRVLLLYGARKPPELLFKEELKRWPEEIEVHVTVDVGDSNWHGETGVVTTLFRKVEMPISDAYAVVCGPPVMMRFVARDLLEMGYPPTRMYFSLERMMKCGIGICGHCLLGDKFICRDGPIFSLREALSLLENNELIWGVIP